jgi:hypothetical protein
MSNEVPTLRLIFRGLAGHEVMCMSWATHLLLVQLIGDRWHA